MFRFDSFSMAIWSEKKKTNFRVIVTQFRLFGCGCGWSGMFWFSTVWWSQTSNADIVDDFFNFLDIILQPIESLAQAVVLQIQQSESSTEVGQETGNLHWTLIIAQCHRIGCKSWQFRCQLQNTHQIIFNVQMESILLRRFHYISKDSRIEIYFSTKWNIKR